MSKGDRFVVFLERLSTHQMDLIGLFDSVDEACGAAYCMLCDGLTPDKFYVTIPERKEPDKTEIRLIHANTQKTIVIATILCYGGTEET